MKTLKPRTLILSFLSLLLLLLSSCTNPFSNKSYSIGIDPGFFSLELDGLEGNVFGFCNELLLEIATIEKVNITLVENSWDVLEQGLKNGDYQGMISGQSVPLKHEKVFDHTSLFLPTGPVLVVPESFSISSYSALSGKIVGIIASSHTAALVERNPSIVIRSIASTPIALNNLEKGSIDGALIPNLFAQNYLNGIYRNKLKIFGEPVTNEGLHLITLYNQNRDLINMFNSGLEKLKDSGRLAELQKKWSLIYF